MQTRELFYKHLQRLRFQYKKTLEISLVTRSQTSMFGLRTWAPTFFLVLKHPCLDWGTWAEEVYLCPTVPPTIVNQKVSFPVNKLIFSQLPSSPLLATYSLTPHLSVGCIDKLYTQKGKVFCLPWELNFLLSCFGLSALHSRIFWNSWPSPPA